MPTTKVTKRVTECILNSGFGEALFVPEPNPSNMAVFYSILHNQKKKPYFLCSPCGICYSRSHLRNVAPQKPRSSGDCRTKAEIQKKKKLVYRD